MFSLINLKHGFIFKILLELKMIITFYYSNQITSVQMENINYLCNVCKIEEDYAHFFMSCKYLDMIWNKINEMFKKTQI